MNASHSRLLSGSLAPRGTIIQTDKKQRRINLNVGGKNHSPYVSTLKNVPDSPLAWIIRKEYQNSLDYDPVNDVYFFDRHPGVFSQVLNYFQTGKLHCPRDVCGPMFQAELNFWGIDETQMEACCWPNYTKHREIQENLRMFHVIKQSEENDDHEHTHPEKHTNVSSRRGKWTQYRNKIWEILDEPYSTKMATVFAYVSLGFIVLSIVTYSVMTMKSLTEKKVCEAISNSTARGNVTQNCTTKSTYLVDAIGGFEILLAGWFTVEIVLRCIFCPDKWEFMKELSNWVDLLAVVPVYLLILLKEPNETLMILNLIRYVRIFRFFKLLYDLHILGKTLQASMNQLFILLLILCVPALIVSSIIYYTEINFGTEDSKKNFSDIPKAFRWSVVTMTTVGYGRVTPVSPWGRLVGGVAALIGILIVSMTASVIGSSFQQYYQVARTQVKIPAKNRKKIKLENEATLVGLLRSMDKKPGSIQSDDSKDSGYGRSPIPPGVDSETSSSSPQAPRERNVIISIEKRKRIERRETTML